MLIGSWDGGENFRVGIFSIFSNYNHNMYQIKHNVQIQYHGNYIEVKNIQVYAWHLHF